MPAIKVSGMPTPQTYATRRPAIGEAITFTRWAPATQAHEPITGTVIRHHTLDGTVIAVMTTDGTAYDYIDGDTAYTVISQS